MNRFVLLDKVCRCTAEVPGVLGCSSSEDRVGQCGNTKQALCCTRWVFYNYINI